MKCCAVVLVALISLTTVAAEDEKGKAIEQEQKKLQGKWKQVSVEMQGKEAAVPERVSVVVTIDGDKWTTEIRKGTIESRFSIDPTQNPKAFDRIRKGKDEKAKDVVEKCIYKLDKDTLTICTARTGLGVDQPGLLERPKEFKTTEGGTIFVYKRVKE